MKVVFGSIQPVRQVVGDFTYGTVLRITGAPPDIPYMYIETSQKAVQIKPRVYGRPTHKLLNLVTGSIICLPIGTEAREFKKAVLYVED